MTEFRTWRLLALLAVFAPLGCSGLGSTGESQWRSLFNGKDLDGWTILGKPSDLGSGRAMFSVEDESIVAHTLGRKGHDYVWLATNDEYTDFILRLRFQAYHNSPGNSGVQIRSRYDQAAGWMDGPQIDINPPGAWRTGMVWDETRGVQRWLCPDVPRGKWVDPSMAPPGLKFKYKDDEDGWNDLQIRVKGMQVRALLNGKTVTWFDGAGLLDDAPHRKHRVGERGVIALQIHKGDELHIRFKDIQIRDNG